MKPVARPLLVALAITLSLAAGLAAGRLTAPKPRSAPPPLAVSIPVRVVTKEIHAPRILATLERVRNDQGLEGTLICHTILKGEIP